jgi:hypothetical protein
VASFLTLAAWVSRTTVQISFFIDQTWAGVFIDKTSVIIDFLDASASRDFQPCTVPVKW